MKYLHILTACAAEPWALQREKLVAISNFLIFKSGGGSYSAEEVQARIGKGQEREIAKSEGLIGVLPIVGVISQRVTLMDDISGGGGASTERLARDFRALLGNDEVKAIVLDIHSPGGQVYGTAEFAEEIYNSRGKKPIIAQVNSLAASAAYWIATAADEIVVTPSGQAGSIGVYSMHEDISKYLENEGVKETIVYAGKYKAEGNPYEPLGEEARAHMQLRTDELYNDFVEAVARGRKVSTKKVNDDFGQGRVYGAKALVERGMADRVGTMTETLERFGLSINPVANKARSERVQSFAEKISAGVQPSVREWEEAFKGLGLSNSQAERAVATYLPARSPGDPAPKKTAEPNPDTSNVAEALAALKATLAGISLK